MPRTFDSQRLRILRDTDKRLSAGRTPDRTPEGRMSQRAIEYKVLQSIDKPVIMETELDALRDHLPDLERLLLSLLVKVQRAQGKEPSVLTRAERRRG